MEDKNGLTYCTIESVPKKFNNIDTWLGLFNLLCHSLDQKEKHFLYQLSSFIFFKILFFRFHILVLPFLGPKGRQAWSQRYKKVFLMR